MQARFMKEKRSFFPILLFQLLFFTAVILDVLLIVHIRDEAKTLVRLDEELLMQTLRNQQIDLELYEQFISYEEADGYDRYAYLFGYLYSGLTKKDALDRQIRRFIKRYPTEYERYYNYEKAIWSNLELFPVAESINNPSETVAFEDSWMQSRTFGGDRGHEGCDIMASFNVRGHYPIFSVCDGVVEKIGWLPQGGYRIGVRGSNGAYFYYAHLYDYAKDFEPGDKVATGELLGFMGDSGYSEIEGTVGNFAVHLHFGIYLNDENGEEFSVNSYAPLKYLETRKKKCIF